MRQSITFTTIAFVTAAMILLQNDRDMSLSLVNRRTIVHLEDPFSSKVWLVDSTLGTRMTLKMAIKRNGRVSEIVLYCQVPVPSQMFMLMYRSTRCSPRPVFTVSTVRGNGNASSLLHKSSLTIRSHRIQPRVHKSFVRMTVLVERSGQKLSCSMAARWCNVKSTCSPAASGPASAD